MESEGFVLIKKKHAAKRNKNVIKGLQCNGNKEELIDFSFLLKDMENKRKQLKDSQIFRDLKYLLQTWQTPKILVSFGLGNISTDRIAKFQFSMLLCLMEYLKLNSSSSLTYDPAYTATDLRLLEHYSITAITTNEEGKHPCNQPTLFYMPHCGRALYNNLLWSNWRLSRMRNLCLLGNSLESIINCNTEEKLIKYYPCIHQLHGWMEERELQNSFDHNDVFNNLSMHVFNNVKYNKVIQNKNKIDDTISENQKEVCIPGDGGGSVDDDGLFVDIFDARPPEVEYDDEEEDIVKAH